MSSLRNNSGVFNGKGFVDISIQPRNCDSLAKIVSMLWKYGYMAVGVSEGILKECGSEGSSDVLLFPRHDIITDSLNEVKKTGKRKKGLLKVLHTENLSLFRQAATLRGIDVIRVKPSMARYLDKSQANLLKKRDKIVELSLPEYLSSRNGFYRFSIAIKRIYAYDIPFALASDSSEPVDVWMPDMIQGLLMLIGIPEPYTVLPITVYPLTVIRELVLGGKE